MAQPLLWSPTRRHFAGHDKEWGVLVIGRRYQVYSVKDKPEGEKAVWVKAGMAFVNRDGSLNVYLDVLPLDGKLHVREALEKREEAKPAVQQQLEVAPVDSLGGH